MITGVSKSKPTRKAILYLSESFKVRNRNKNATAKDIPTKNRDLNVITGFFIVLTKIALQNNTNSAKYITSKRENK